MSQRDRILDFLEYRGERGITALDALGEEGVLRLAARIKELREAGHVIVSRTETTPNGARIARYVLIPPVQRKLWPNAIAGSQGHRGGTVTADGVRGMQRGLR